MLAVMVMAREELRTATHLSVGSFSCLRGGIGAWYLRGRKKVKM
jgi:hypothetical protein